MLMIMIIVMKMTMMTECNILTKCRDQSGQDKPKQKPSYPTKRTPITKLNQTEPNKTKLHETQRN
jgi:hypothetical protein